MFRYLYVYFVAKLYYTANKFVFNYVYVKASILNTFILFNCMSWFVLHIWRNKTKLFKKLDRKSVKCLLFDNLVPYCELVQCD